MHRLNSPYDQAARLRELMVGQLDAGPFLSTRPFVVTITSGKGGVGKSTIALNVALKVGDLCKNVLLVDADENLGTQDILLGIVPKYRLADVVRGKRTVEEALVSVSDHVKLLAGNSGELSYPAFVKEKQRQFLHALFSTRERFDLVVIDTGAGISDTIVEYARASDLTIVVSHPEPTAVLDAYAMIKIIHHAHPAARVKILMNAVHHPAEGDEAVMKLQLAIRHFLKIDLPYLGVIPYDRHVSKAIARQEPLVRCYPSSGASLSLGLLARQIVSSSHAYVPEEAHKL